MKAIHKICMDLSRGGCKPVVAAVQGEANTRQLDISLFNNGNPWEAPKGTTAAVAFQKPDGTKGLYDKLPDGANAVTFSGGLVSAILAPQALTCAGNVLASVIFCDPQLDLLATFPFIIKVEPNPAAGEQVSNNYYALQNLDQVNAAYQELLTREVIDVTARAEIEELKENGMGGGTVKTVNGLAPDENGNVNVAAPTDDQVHEAVQDYLDAHPEAVVTDEPADDDIPKVFIEGVIPTTKDDVLAVMEYISKNTSFKAYLKIKCQGTSSMSYDKKNFTIKMYADEARETKLKMAFKDWGHLSNKYVLKANYIDHSHARNIICANLWDEVVASRPDYDTLPAEMRNSPRNGAIDGFPIKVYTNGTYQGIYTWNIGKDDWMFGMDEDNANHVLLCAETNTDGVYAENACNFRALWSGVDEDDWSIEVGANSAALKSSLNALISCVKDTDDATFKATIGNYLDVQSAIDYYLHQYVIAGIDGLAKNMLLASFDGKRWICGAYDMDSTFGLTPQGATSIVRTDYACPAEYKEQFSLLWQRLINSFPEAFHSRYAELRKNAYTLGNIVTKFERFLDRIGTELLAEDATIYSIPSADTNNIKYLRDFVRDRLVYTDAMIPSLGVGVPATSLTLDKAELVFYSFDPITITASVTPANCTDAVVWASSDESVAVVRGGVVTPLRAGNCKISVRCGFYSAECTAVVLGSATEYLKWSDGHFLSGATGEALPAEGDSCTDFVNLRGATKFVGFMYQNYAASTGRYHFYDINKAYISYTGAYENLDYADSLQVPDGAVYVRFYQKTDEKAGVTFLTDTFKNGFAQMAASKFVANKIPSANGIVDAGNTIGYFDESIPVTEGQVFFLFNAYRLDYTGPDAVYPDRDIYFFDTAGNYAGKAEKNNVGLVAAGSNGQFMVEIPAGVASVKIGAHNTAKDYIWYRVMG